jgi:hypothetical protein
MKFNISKEWCEKSAKFEDGCEVGAGVPPQFRTQMGWLPTLTWKIRDAYHCRRKLGIGWRFAWQHAEAHVEQNWHLEMTPKQAAQEEAYAWAASC